jgi:alpha-glucosidase (family GH31 glycosyl hydrolase)
MKQLYYILVCCCLCFSKHAFAGEYTNSIVGMKTNNNTLLLMCSDSLRVAIILERDDIIRIKSTKNHDFKSSLMIQKGFVYDNFPLKKYIWLNEKNRISVKTALFTMEISKNPFIITLFHADESKATTFTICQMSDDSESQKLLFNMGDEEHFYGFGFMRSTFDAKGKQLTWKKEYRWKEATVPYFVSTNNYAFYSNNTWAHHFDFRTGVNRKQGNERYSVTAEGGQTDFYLIVHKSMKDILNSYTDLTGKSMLVPKWALGVQYRCRYSCDQKEAISIAEEFRRRDLPLDVMGLEPGWEGTPYGNTWKWSPERFPNPAQMIRDMNKMNLHFDLWESGTAPYKNILDTSVLTKWYAQRLPILNDGVESFKQDDPYPRLINSEGYDPASLIKNSIQSGIYSDGELRNIANSVYSQTAFSEYRKHTGKRAVIQFHAYNASVASHRWPYQWAGDFSSGNGMLNAGLSAHPLASEDMRDYSPKGLHNNLLATIPIVDSWAYFREPWLFKDEVLSGYRFYARLRYKLIPYFYSTLWQSHQTGIPVLRPLVLEFPKDTSVYNLTSEYMIGDYLLLIGNTMRLDETEAKLQGDDMYEGKLYLPQGNWIDYWTGDTYNLAGQGKVIKTQWPHFAGGALFVKAGAIIPTCQVENYISTVNPSVFTLDVYPHPASESTGSLYEDDGVTYGYEKSNYCLTEISCKKQSINTISLKIGKRTGRFEDMSKQRTFLIKVFSEFLPEQVVVDGVKIPMYRNADSLVYGFNIGWAYDSATKKIFIKPHSFWKFERNEQRIERNQIVDYELDRIVERRASGITGEMKINIKLKSEKAKIIDNKFGSVKEIKSGVQSNSNTQLTVLTNPLYEVLMPGKDSIHFSFAYWTKPRISVYAKITQNGETVKTMNGAKVDLKVLNKSRELLKTYSEELVNGEAVFTIEYQRPAQYYYVVSCQGYKDIELKVFDNTWDYTLDNGQLRKPK